MKLYGSYTSPFVRHARIAMMQNGYEFEFIEIDPATSAQKSPTSKVPLLEDGDLTLTDSTSILKYVREKSGQSFLNTLEDHELFAMSTTLLDSALNLFMLELEGFGPEQINYLGRQKNRVMVGLKELDRRFDPADGIVLDSALRCACFLDWGLFRNRFRIDELGNLRGLLEAANQVAEFASTPPPR